jgi:predicted Zn finger-like uncharacterized protein
MHQIVSCPKCHQKLKIPQTALGRTVRCPCGNAFAAQANGATAAAAPHPQPARPAGMLTSCPHCRQQLRIPETARGRQVKCPKCATAFAVPAGEAAVAPSSQIQPRVVAQPRPASQAVAIPKKQAAPALDDDWDEPTPRRVPSRVAKKGKGLDVVAIGVGAVVLLYGAVLTLAAAGLFDKKADTGPLVRNNRPAKEKLDLSYIAADFNGAAIIHPARLLKSPLLAKVPKDKLDKMAADMEKEVGFDPRKVERVVLLLEPFPENNVMASPAGIIRFADPVDGKKILGKVLGQMGTATFKKKDYYRSTTWQMARVPVAGYVADDRTILLAPEPTLRKMLLANAPKSPLLDGLRDIDLDNDIVALFCMDQGQQPASKMTVRQAAGMTLNEAKANLPPQLAAITTVPDRLKSVTLALNLSGDTLLKVVLEGKDKESADVFEKLVNEGLKMVRQGYKEVSGMLMAMAPPDLAGSLDKVAKDLLDGITTSKDGPRLTVSVKMPRGLDRLAAKLIQAAQGQVRPPKEGWPPKETPKETPPQVLPEDKATLDALRKTGGYLILDYKRPPPQPVIGVNLSYNPTVTDATLALVKKLPNVEQVYLASTKVTPAGLATLESMPRLKVLDLTNVKIADAEMGKLAKLAHLENLRFDARETTDAGLEKLAALTNLKQLYLRSSRITDGGLAHLGKLKKLETLDLGQTKITGTGLANLQKAPLTVLSLDWTKVDDAGLANLAPVTGLTELNLGFTGVTDTGLASLRGMKKLYRLSLMGTGITGTGLQGVPISGLLTAPQTRFNDDGLKAIAGNTQLTNLELASTQVTDAGLAHLEGLTNLQNLSLAGTKVTDAGLAHLKGLTNLQTLYLAQTGVTGTGLVALKGNQKLYHIDLWNAKITDDGLKFVKELSGKLISLTLNNTPITDAGLAHFKGMDKFSSLSFSDTRITDAGLANLEGLTKLTMITLNNTQITKAGLDKLKKALPKCNVYCFPAPK